MEMYDYAKVNEKLMVGHNLYNDCRVFDTNVSKYPNAKSIG